MLEMLIGTGVRVGELLGLCVGDVEIGERSGKFTSPLMYLCLMIGPEIEQGMNTS